VGEAKVGRQRDLLGEGEEELTYINGYYKPRSEFVDLKEPSKVRIITKTDHSAPLGSQMN
jgi:hypothetical protein